MRAGLRSWDNAFRAAAVRGEEGSARLITEKMASEMPYPKSMPAFRRFEVDPDGRVWLQEYTPTRAERELWMVVDPRSEEVRATQMPRRFTPLAFSPTSVFGVWRDDDLAQAELACKLGSHERTGAAERQQLELARVDSLLDR